MSCQTVCCTICMEGVEFVQFFSDGASVGEIVAGQFCDGSRVDFELLGTPIDNTVVLFRNGKQQIIGVGLIDRDYRVVGNVIELPAGTAPESIESISGHYWREV